MHLFTGRPSKRAKKPVSCARKAELEVVVKKIEKRLWMSQKEDREETDEPAVSTHREAFASFSTCIQWVEGQLDCDIVSILLLRRFQQKACSEQMRNSPKTTASLATWWLLSHEVILNQLS